MMTNPTLWQRAFTYFPTQPAYSRERVVVTGMMSVALAIILGVVGIPLVVLELSHVHGGLTLRNLIDRLMVSR